MQKGFALPRPLLIELLSQLTAEPFCARAAIPATSVGFAGQLVDLDDGLMLRRKLIDFLQDTLSHPVSRSFKLTKQRRYRFGGVLKRLTTRC